VGPAYRSQTVGIGQSQIEQDKVNRTRRQMMLSVPQALYMRQLDLLQALVVQHLAQQTRVSWIIFDQEKYFDRFLRHPL
jgi:hypothetical protein